MKKYLLLGTIFVATAAFAFGGGYKKTIVEIDSGVKSIGVHISTTSSDNSLNPSFTCPDNSTWSASAYSCVCNSGYVMDGNTCVPASEDKCKTAQYTDCQTCAMVGGKATITSKPDGTICQTGAETPALSLHVLSWRPSPFAVRLCV